MAVHQTHLSHPKYRPDIDGLRALAVLAVVAFHAFPYWVKGGFIGVDVFFVISGYLISTIIFENLEKGTFSFSEFYARRVKRIFPALIIVLVACLVFGWFSLLADEYKQLGKHIAAGAGFVSNIAFWNEANYFDNSTDTKPLLHLWSLGIEEQFYVIWPFFLWFAWRRKFNLLTVTVVFAIASFALNLKGVKQGVAAAFYSPQTRFWELLSGSCWAWVTLYKSHALVNLGNKLDGYIATAPDGEGLASACKALPNVLSFFGFVLLAYGFWRINKELAFPGHWALVPVTGTLLILMGGSKSWINRKILSNRMAVWLGLISFPLYLWHWPLLSFARIVGNQEPSRNLRMAAVALSILLAWLTYKLVERPLRFGKHNKATVAALVLLRSATGVAGYYIYIHGGLIPRKNSALIEKYTGDIGHFEYHKYIAEKYFTCAPESIAKESIKWEGFILCNQSKPDLDIDIALVGDSHAEHLFLGMAEALPNKNVVFYIKNSSPFLGNPEFKNIFEAIAASKSIKQVILTEHWVGRHSAMPAGSALDKELIKIIDALSKSGKNVYLTDDIPLFPNQPISCKGVRWPLDYQEKTCEIEVGEVNKQRDVYINALRRVVESRPRVKIINIGNYLCGDKVCRMTNGSNILYRDNNHLNLIGSEYIGKRMVEDNKDIFGYSN